MIDKVDLLAHIGASATRHNDERYQQQVRAYLEFQGNVVGDDRPALPPISSGHLHQPIDAEDTSHVSQHGVGEVSMSQDGTTMFLDDTQLAYNALDSQLITSSFVMPSQVSIRSASQRSGSSRITTVNRNSRHLGEVKAFTEHQQLDSDDEIQGSEQRSLQNAGSAGTEMIPAGLSAPRPAPHTHPLSQSSYLKSPVLDRACVNKKRRLNDNGTSSGCATESGVSRRAISFPLPGPSGPGFAFVNNQAIQSTEDEPQNRLLEDGEGQHSYDTTSELPTSYSLSDITSESSRARNRAITSQRSVSDPGPRTEFGEEASVGVASASNGAEKGVDGLDLQSKPNTIISALAPSTPKKFKQKAQEPAYMRVEKYIQTKPANINHTNVEPSPTINPTVEGQQSGPAQLIINTLPRIIRPPSPPVGIDTYTSHLTPSLTWLATESPIKNSYKPISVCREIRPLERGYWLIDPLSWKLHAQHDFWQYMQRFIGGGSAGWGIWCYRGDDVNAAIGDENADGDSGGGLGLVKIYCWGEAVEHVYLLLYVASKSQVRKLGLVWVDAEEKVVVRMRHW